MLFLCRHNRLISMGVAEHNGGDKVVTQYNGAMPETILGDGVWQPRAIKGSVGAVV